MTHQLNSDQEAALASMQEFLQGRESFFLLLGAAGTGKTFTIRSLVEGFKGRLIFTAPTNKATKVLEQTFLAEDLGCDYKPECCTIFSLLGLRLEANGEIKELSKPEKLIDLSRYAAVIIDEVSMMNSHLWEYVQRTAHRQKVKFIMMGDAAQLPPVGEATSPAWSISLRATLTKVVRHDNQILTLATRLRQLVDHPAPSLVIADDYDHQVGEGVRRVPLSTFEELISIDAHAGKFNSGEQKAVAWRNVTVNHLNSLIRKNIFAVDGEFFPGDRVILTEPARDIISEEFVATTDAEGTVERSEEAYHPTFTEFLCWRVVAQLDEGHPVTLWKLHSSAGNINLYSRRLTELAASAKTDRRLWPKYWAFREGFHQFRYGYAITAHRSQGSTYNKVFVNSFDILQNRNRQEAFRCLYVACTRPRKQLIIY